MQTNESLAWYRQFWPWVLLTLPSVAVVACIVTWVLAVQSADGVVSEDYYKQGLAINQVLDREHSAAALGLNAEMQFDWQAARLSLRLSMREPRPLPEHLQLVLSHPTRAGFDQQMTLSRDASGVYQADLPQLDPAAWYLSLSDLNQTWRLSGRCRLPESTQFKLTATE